MNKYRKGTLAAAIFVSMVLAGCGQAKVPAEVEVTSLAIAEDGTITSYLVDVFDKEYYDISELTSMAINEAAEYNTQKQTGTTVPVTVDKVEASGDDSGKIVVTHIYHNAETYSDFNESLLFYGTAQEAVTSGYDLDNVLKSVKDGSLISEEQLLADEKGMIVITDAKAKVYCPRKVTHISEGAVYENGGSVDTTQTDEIVMILMKK